MTTEMTTMTAWVWVQRDESGEGLFLGSYESRRDLIADVEYHYAGDPYRIVEERPGSCGTMVVVVDEVRD